MKRSTRLIFAGGTVGLLGIALAVSSLGKDERELAREQEREMRQAQLCGAVSEMAQKVMGDRHDGFDIRTTDVEILPVTAAMLNEAWAQPQIQDAAAAEKSALDFSQVWFEKCLNDDIPGA